MAKSKKSAPAKTVVTATTSKRAGYKRKSNKRVNVLHAQLARQARKALKRANYRSKEEREEEKKILQKIAIESVKTKKVSSSKPKAKKA